MKIKKTLETPEGNVQFEGELNQDELDLIITVGLNYLMQQGAIPFRVMPGGTAASVSDGSTSTQ